MELKCDLNITLKCDRDITLKQIEMEDAPVIFRIIDAQRDYLGPWLPFVEQTRELSDTESFVKSVVGAPSDRFEYIFTIRARNEMAGLIGFKLSDRANRKTEIGYWLSRPFQGRGIMTRSVSCLLDFAFDKLEMNRVQIKCAAGNQPSIKIPLRLGFRSEGIERDGELLSGERYTDLEVFSILKREWEANRAKGM